MSAADSPAGERPAESHGAPGDRADQPARPPQTEASAVVRGMADAILVYDRRGRCIDANLAALELLGYARGELARLGALDLVCPEPGWGRDEYRQLVRDGRWRGDLRVRRSDGTCLDVDVQVTPIALPSGPAYVCVLRDISERVRAEAAQRLLADAGAFLARSLDYETTLRNVARITVPELADWCSVAVVEEGGRIRQVASAHADPSGEALVQEVRERYPFGAVLRTGARAALARGESLLVPEIGREMLVNVAQDESHLAMLERLAPRSMMTVPLVARGRTLGALTLVRVAGGAGGRYGEEELRLAEMLAQRAALATDNARLYRRAREALAARDSALAAVEAALGVRDEFLSLVSHDLQTPLTTILGTAQLMSRRIAHADSPELRELNQHVERIQGTALRMSALVDELMDVVQLERGQGLQLERRPVDLIRLITAVVDEQQQTTRRHTIRIESALNGLVGRWDARRLERVLLNLIANAIKYSPDGGEIIVRVGQEGGDDDAAGWAQVSVEDQGIGIPAEDLPRVFERFHRGANVAGRIAGSGIGLAGVKQIVEQHGGTVLAESTEGRGSVITLRLPLS